ncbi:MAG: MFS transporter, partial [Paraglaciecola sp.]|nr:MFS transporter [Paraglaciecola sp.]
MSHSNKPILSTLAANDASVFRIKLLTYMMFFVFAMTSDAVGVIIPELIKNYGLNLTQASAFHYVPMIFIALSALFLGYLADKWGRKSTIIIGLLIFAIACFLFALGSSFLYFIALLAMVGIAVGLFKTGALALIGDISSSNKEHTATMNTVEGFFGVGAMVGPAIVSYMLVSGVSWKYLYICAGVLCALLCLAALKTNYPKVKADPDGQVNLKSSFEMMKDPYAIGFSMAIALYVATEVAIYVWMP